MSSVGPRRVGNYRLLAQLGSGGMADVYLAVDDRLAVTKLLVVKRVRSNLAEDADFRTLLLDEARVCARLNHPNIVQVFDVGFEEGEVFLAMEYLDGQTMNHVVKRAAGKLNPEIELLVVCDVLRAVHYAHTLTDFDGTPLAIVHRDVSPQNIFVTYDGVVKLLDFGIAKATGRAVETREGFMRGKLRYMAPEQLRGMTVDGRYDVFAAGILVWQAVTDRRFWDDLFEQIVMRKLATYDYDPSPRRINPSLPEAIDNICRRALAPVADERYPTAAAMLADLEEYLGDRVVTLRRELVAAMKDLFEDERQKRRAIIEDVAATTTIANAIGAVALKSARSSDPSSTEPLVSAMPIDVADETRSLANMLEPSLANIERRRRPRAARWIAGAGGLLAVAGVSLLALGARAPDRASARPAAAIDDDKVGVVLASDSVLGIASVRPAATASASASASASAKPAPPTRPVRPRPSRAAKTPSTPSTSSTGAGPKPDVVDTSDPWK